MRNRFIPAPAILGLLVAACFGLAQATPTTPQVVHGQATFNQQGNVFSITNTPNTIIHWQSFNIAAGDITRFIQQGSDSAVLNRIVGQHPSQILGALQSNGHVFLINPNGILFGKGARIDVQGLTASTLALSDNDFLAGRRHFRAGSTAGRLDQQGAITTPKGGRVFLVASGVENSGIITSPEGQVVLAAGHTVQLADSDNPSLHVVVSAPQSQSVNLGQVIAQGGKVGIYGALVSQRARVNADRAQLGPNGQVVLRASRDATLAGSSVTSSRGGGAVSVEGERVAMLDQAQIDTSGAASGGSVMLGGGFQGRNAQMRNASALLFGKNASISADATAQGDGGTVVLWGNDSTRARGTISARGAGTGKGGLVETSGKWLDVNGARVQAGTWLLDPFDIDIGLEGSGSLDQADAFGDPGTRVTLAASLLSSSAPGTHVVLQATNDVTFSAPVNANLGTGSLTVDAGNNILLNSSIATGGGALRLTANHPAYASGTGQIVSAAGSSIDTGGGGLAMQAASVALVGPIATVGGRLDINGANSVLVTGSLDSGGGALSLTGSDVHVGGASALVNSAGGAMALNALGGAVQLDSGARLRSSNYIAFNTDRAELLGDIDGVEGFFPTVNFSTHTPGRGISFGGGSDTLALDPGRLAAFKVEGFNIGHAGATGNIDVFVPYADGHATRMNMTTQGDIRIGAPVTLPASQNSSLILQIATRPPGGGRAEGSITTAPDAGSATVVPGGRLAADHVSLHAGKMSLGATISGTGQEGEVEIGTNSADGKMLIGVDAQDSAGTLGLSSGELSLVRAAALRLEGNLGQSAGLTVTAGGMDFTGVLDRESVLQIDGGSGDVLLNGKLMTPGGMELIGQRLITASGARAGAEAMSLHASGGIGTLSTAFETQTTMLRAFNDAGGASAPIHIRNTGPLSLGRVRQSGPGVQGAIDIAATGELNVFDVEPEGAGERVIIETQGPGGIKLVSGGAMTVLGEVRTAVGPINLDASAGVMRIAAGGKIESQQGDIGLRAHDLVNDGRVYTGAGNIAVSANTFAGTGSYEAPGGTITGLPTPPPTVEQCLGNGALAGCDAILRAALEACVADPAGPLCSRILPTLAICISNPATYGCSVVLPSLAACTAAPLTPGCSVVLPSLATCTASPATPGCSAVLPSLATCTASPATPGCSAVLPSLATCTASPGTPGCSAVLPSLATCTASPATPGCSAVLPSLATCTASPATPGCSAVLPSLATCTASPATPGCSAVLPSLATCTASPATPGCAVVLPSLALCTSAPATPGCSAVLPSLAACILNPAAQGCAAVLPTLATCIASPASAGCSVVLPSLASCIGNPGAPGCSVVLPTLSTCVSEPARAGCVAVLPTRDQCLASPALQGCSVVLPLAELCQVAPSAQGCPGGLPTPEETLVPETRLAADAANDTSDKLKNPGETALVAAIKEGEPANVRIKTYCN